MVKTTTTAETRVNDGDTTTHSIPASYVIQSASIRWQGVDDTTTETKTKEKIGPRNSSNSTTSISSTTNFPYVDSGWSFVSHEAGDNYRSFSDNTGTVTYETTAPWGSDTQTSTSTSASGSYTYTSVSTTNNYTGDNATFSISADNTISATVEVFARTTMSRTVTNSTTDPSVSGDASASYSGTISDTNWTGWVSLTGFSSGDNTLNHSIGGSGVADYQIEYTYIEPPTAPQTLTVTETN